MARNVFSDHDHKPPPPPPRQSPRDEPPARPAAKIEEETTWADHPHSYPPPVVREPPVVELRTTDPEDIQLLADEIVALCKTSAYDDMTWAEIDNALRLASHKVKLVFVEHGTLDPSP